MKLNLKVKHSTEDQTEAERREQSADLCFIQAERRELIYNTGSLQWCLNTYAVRNNRTQKFTESMPQRGEKVKNKCLLSSDFICDLKNLERF